LFHLPKALNDCDSYLSFYNMKFAYIFIHVKKHAPPAIYLNYELKNTIFS